MIFVLFGSIISMMKIHIMGSLKFHIKIWKHTIFHLPIKFSFLTQSIKRALQRYSKDLNLAGHLTTNLISIPFKIHSIDVTLCPYELGLTIRTEVNTAPNMTLSEAIEFAARFRVLETKMIQMGLFVLNVTEKVFPSGKIHFWLFISWRNRFL